MGNFIEAIKKYTLIAVSLAVIGLVFGLGFFGFIKVLIWATA